jgi:hypothetical protein
MHEIVTCHRRRILRNLYIMGQPNPADNDQRIEETYFCQTVHPNHERTKLSVFWCHLYNFRQGKGFLKTEVVFRVGYLALYPSSCSHSFLVIYEPRFSFDVFARRIMDLHVSEVVTIYVFVFPPYAYKDICLLKVSWTPNSRASDWHDKCKTADILQRLFGSWHPKQRQINSVNCNNS